MSITSTLSTIRSIVAASSGIATSYTTQPGSITADNLPAAITMVGPARWQEQAVGLFRQDRTYTIRVYVMPVSLGLGIGEGYAACEPVLNALGATFLRNVTLSNTVDHIQNVRDGGIRGDYSFADGNYFGFEMSLDVTEKST